MTQVVSHRSDSRRNQIAGDGEVGKEETGREPKKAAIQVGVGQECADQHATAFKTEPACGLPTNKRGLQQTTRQHAGYP